MDIKNKIKILKKQIKLNELSNDSYYLSNQYKQDIKTLEKLEKEKNNTFSWHFTLSHLSFSLKEHKWNNKCLQQMILMKQVH